MKGLKLLILCSILTVGALTCVGCACGANMDNNTEAPYEDNVNRDNALNNGYDNNGNQSIHQSISSKASRPFFASALLSPCLTKRIVTKLSRTKIAA